MRNRWEKRTARQLKANLIKGSGSQWDAKSDLTDGTFRYEAKETDAEFYRLSTKTWLKIVIEAYQRGQQPVLLLRLRALHLAAVDPELLVGREDLVYHFFSPSTTGFRVCEKTWHSLVLCPDYGTRYPAQHVTLHDPTEGTAVFVVIPFAVFKQVRHETTPSG